MRHLLYRNPLTMATSKQDYSYVKYVNLCISATIWSINRMYSTCITVIITHLPYRASLETGIFQSLNCTEIEISLMFKILFPVFCGCYSGKSAPRRCFRLYLLMSNDNPAERTVGIAKAPNYEYVWRRQLWWFCWEFGYPMKKSAEMPSKARESFSRSRKKTSCSPA